MSDKPGPERRSEPVRFNGNRYVIIFYDYAITEKPKDGERLIEEDGGPGTFLLMPIPETEDQDLGPREAPR
jgi:hypothetical protein